MSSDAPEVRSVLDMLLRLLGSCKEPLKAQEVGNMLYGMQERCPEVRQCWICFLDCSAAAGAVEGQNVGNMLYGMQGMSSDAPEVRSVLDMLPALLGSCRPLEEREVGNALYGLSSLNNIEKFIPFLEVWLESGQNTWWLFY
jgi:hypothetical protein